MRARSSSSASGSAVQTPRRSAPKRDACLIAWKPSSTTSPEVRLARADVREGQLRAVGVVGRGGRRHGRPHRPSRTGAAAAPARARRRDRTGAGTMMPRVAVGLERLMEIEREVARERFRSRVLRLAVVSIAFDLVVAALAWWFEQGAPHEFGTYWAALFWTTTQLLTVSSQLPNPEHTGDEGPRRRARGLRDRRRDVARRDVHGPAAPPHAAADAPALQGRGGGGGGGR